MISSEEARSAFIQDRHAEIQLQIDKYYSFHRIISNVRLFIFLVCFVMVVSYFALMPSIIFIIIAAIFFSLFVIAVGVHFYVSKKLNFFRALQAVHDEYIARVHHQFDKLNDDGSDFLDKTHDFSSDLDLFGPNSLFHLINVGQTYFGRKVLRDYLLSAEDEKLTMEQISLRQSAVSEFACDPIGAQFFQSKGRLITGIKKSPKAFLNYTSFYERPDKSLPLWRIIVCAFLTTMLTCSFILSLLFAVDLYWLSLLIISVQLLIVAFSHQKFKLSFEAISGIQSELYAYKSLFEIIENAEPKAALLKMIKQDIYGEESAPNRVSDQLKSIHRICLFIQVRSQPLLFLILNALFLYDHYCLFFLDRWVDRSGQALPKYLDALGRWEAIMSLSTLNFVYPEAVYPTIVQDNQKDQHQTVCFQATDMGHPLIPTGKQVRNDFDLSHGIALITGSNMSGKTTLLRTVGINTVLAYSGAICCARSIHLSVMHICTSMRIADSLDEGMSTFYAELMRIERIVRKSKEEKPMLFLIDEIFRGTNSKDRTDGAQIIIDNLSKKWVIGMMSTHDYQLCDVYQNRTEQIIFYYFSERYDEEGIHFDYKLSKGISKSANARYLMKLVGIE